MSGFWVWGVRVLGVGCQGPFWVQGIGGFRDEGMFEGFLVNEESCNHSPKVPVPVASSQQSL